VKRFYFLGPVVSVVLIIGASLRATAGDADSPEKVKKTITVFAAASTTSAIDEIKQQFVKQTGINIQTSYAASALLANQIVNGADADIFISADAKWADYLADKHLVAKRRDALGNYLVIVTPNGLKLDLTKPEDMLLPTVEHIAIGEPATAPAGKYAKQALAKLDLWEKLKDKVVPAQDVRQALAYVETGAAEAGIVYVTDAAISKKVKVAFAIPEKLTEQILYPIVLLVQAKEKSEAESFYAYLFSPQATKIYKKFGFATLINSDAPDK
jgi:molybdate transport system substrate-binding protein